MSFVNDVKVATTYYINQTDNISMNNFGTEPTLLRIIKVQEYL